MSAIEREVDRNGSFECLLVLSEGENFFDLSSDDEEALVDKRSERDKASNNSEKLWSER